MIDRAQLLGQTNSHLLEMYPNHWVHQQAVTAIKSLQQAAQHAGFDLRLASSFRSFDQQNLIWGRKFTGQRPVLDIDNQAINIDTLTETQLIKAICLYSAIPGLSRHHWGTDFDIYDAKQIAGKDLQLVNSEYQKHGPCYEMNCWLADNLSQFDFATPYSRQAFQQHQSVAAEPWHISFFPIATNAEKHHSSQLVLQAWQTAKIQGKASLIADYEHWYQTYFRSYFLSNL